MSLSLPPFPADWCDCNKENIPPQNHLIEKPEHSPKDPFPAHRRASNSQYHTPFPPPLPSSSSPPSSFPSMAARCPQCCLPIHPRDPRLSPPPRPFRRHSSSAPLRLLSSSPLPFSGPGSRLSTLNRTRLGLSQRTESLNSRS